ncbi:MAG: GntR family transcriptional regulator/MocR family aminotransferase, partial [Yoonia sp.]
MSISVETFFLDPSAEGTLQARIQQMVAQGILAGRFRLGERLPSSRKMAAHLGVSRITVTLAYTELVADDYLTSRGRSGYFVSENAPEPPAFPAQRFNTGTVDWNRAIGQRFTPGLNLNKPADWASYRYPFIYGQADKTLFDTANWRLCALRALGMRDFSALTSDYFDGDDPELVDFIARQTLPRRGILANKDEILITMGAQNALWLSAQVLLNSRRRAAIEDPCYPALRTILTQSRCQLSCVAVDGLGLSPRDLPPDTDVVFTTPSHQCPTTATMPLVRRTALLEKAEADDFVIVEDDYEFEMSFLNAPSPSLKSLDKNGRVIYVGSFSKSLFPGLRLGYLVGPAPFIREARALRATVLRHPPGHI